MTWENTDEPTMRRLIEMGVRMAEYTGTDHPHLEDAKNTLALTAAGRAIRDLYAANDRAMRDTIDCAELARNALIGATHAQHRDEVEHATEAAEKAAGTTDEAAHNTAGDADMAAKIERDMRETAGKLPESMAENIALILDTGVQIRNEIQANVQIIQKTADLTREIAKLTRERTDEFGTETGGADAQ